MAESETECDTPGLDTLGSECVITQVGDLHYAAETEIMSEDKRLELDALHGSDLAKMQGLGPEVGALTCVDTMVETDHDYTKADQTPHYFTTHDIKHEGAETFLGEVLLKAEMSGAGPDHVVKAESDHGGELTVESENGVVIHEAHGLQCNECGEIFSSITDLHQHFEIHKATNPYICVHCGESFAVDSSLKAHMKIHMKEKSYGPTGVELVGKVGIDAFNLKPHQMMHSPEKPHRCSECGKSFAAAITLREHMKMHSDDKPYKCTQCRKSFIRRRHLKKHQEMHARDKPFSCTLCGKGFATASNLKQHQKSHAGDKPHRCMQCGKCFAAAATLREHARIHSGEKPYKCNQCRKSFVRKRHLKKHQLVHSGGKPYRCSHCDKGFNHSSSLSRHNKTHQDGKNMYVHTPHHAHVHTPPEKVKNIYAPPEKSVSVFYDTPTPKKRGTPGDRQYNCRYCEKTFNHSSSLSRHQKTHSDGKSYACSHCGKNFTHSSSLARHQRVHMDEKPIFTVPSPKSYSPVVKQQRILQSEKPYRCSQCGKGFNHSSSLSRHHRIHIDQ